MIASLVSSLVASVLWLIAISTDEWCKVSFDEWSPLKANGSYVKSYNLGLWHLCADLYFNDTSDTKHTAGMRKSVVVSIFFII